MSRAYLVVRHTAALSAAPEFRFLADWVRAEARAVWPEVVELDWEDRAALRRVEGDAVVLLLASDVLVLRRTLAGLERAITPQMIPGAQVAAPVPASRLAGLCPEPPHTVGAFERLEALTLASETRAGDAAGSPAWPISLWRGSALRAALEVDGALEDLLTRTVVPREKTLGLHHRFIDYYGEPRADALAHVPEGTHDVLEIGCGDGTTGALLTERLGCRVTGVELNPIVAARAAERLHRVLVGDVQRVDPGGPYDLVLALELFEHLTEQAEFLARVRTLLAPGGSLLLSVPNAGHYSIVEELIAGRFDYLPIGLLCSTHYRFFTRRTLADWFERAGYRDVRFVAQEAPLPDRVRQWVAASGLPHDVASLGTTGFFVLARP